MPSKISLQCLGKTSESDNKVESNQSATQHILYVALSGGIDSVVLLDLLQKYQTRQPQSAAMSSFELKAIHVNHHLHALADEQALFCQNLCAKRSIAFQQLDIYPSQQEQANVGIEAAARKHRYLAIARYLHQNKITQNHAEVSLQQWLLQGSIKMIKLKPCC